jgi:CPA2 family monovalent cation:H+ antiporter-2
MEGIALALIVCAILAIIARRFALPTIPCYLLAGLVLGRSGLQLVEPSEVSSYLTSLGLLFLLFFMGLEIRPSRIWSNQSAILTSGVIDLLINGVIGFSAAYLLGFSSFDSVIVAAAFFISSTAMAVSSLVENHKLLMREAETVVWLMIFEDIALIVILALLGASSEPITMTLLKIALFLLAIIIIVRVAREEIVAIMKREDDLPVLFTFSVLITVAALSLVLKVPESFMVIALGTALGAVDTGAFERHAKPFRDVFLIIFFVFFGIGIDFFAGGVQLPAIIAISAAAVLSKLASGIVIGRAVHGDALSGIEVWSNTIGRGEFSIAVATLYGSAIVSSTIAAVVIVTSIVGSFVAGASTRIGDGIWALTNKGERNDKPGNGEERSPPVLEGP